jgi:hypothetical protein
VPPTLEITPQGLRLVDAVPGLTREGPRALIGLPVASP